MKIKELTLENIRSYEHQTVEFPDGAILIHGDNGAGKTSLLMGIFGGLFLSKIRNVGTNDFTLDDLVRRGEDKGTVELVFEIDGTEFTVMWKVYSTSTPSSATLDSPAFSEPVTGIGNVREEIIGLLGMDEDDFSSSVYVKQGEIDRLIEAGNRAEMIDSLLGLDELDGYIARMKMARRGAGRIQDRNRTSRENYEDDLDDFKKSEAEYEDEIQSLTEEITGLESDIEEIEAFIDDLKDHRTSIQSDIDDHETLLDRKAEKEDQIADAQENRAQQQEALEESQAAIDEAQNDIGTLEDKIADLDAAVEYNLGTEESAREASDAAQAAYMEATTERNDRENDLQNAQDELERLHDELEDATAERDTLQKEREELTADLDAAKDQLADAESALEALTDERNEATAAFLPTVDDVDAVSDSTEADVEAHLADLRDEREELTATKREITTNRDHTEDTLDTAREELTATEDELAEAESKLETIEEDIADTEDDLADAEAEFERRVDALAEHGSELDIDVTADNLTKLRDTTIPNRIQAVTEDLNDIGTTIAEYRSDKQRYEEELAEIKELGEQDKCPKCGQSVDDAHIEEEVTELEANIAAAEDALADAQTTEDNLHAREAELQSLRTDLLDAIDFREETLAPAREQVAELRDEADELQSRIEELDAAIDEHESTIEELDAELTALEDRETTLEDDIAEINEALDTGEDILALFDDVAEEQDTIADIQTEIDDIEADISDVTDEIADVETKIEELEARIDEQEATVEECESELAAAEDRVEEMDAIRETVSEAVSKYDAIAESRTTIDREEQNIQHCRDRIDDLNSQIARLQEETEEIADQLGDQDIDDLREDLQRVEDRIEQRQETRNEYQDELQTHRDERTRLETELDALRSTKAQIELYERKEQWAQEVHDELDSVISIYESTKSDLRDQYLAYINEYTNDIFKEIYKNSSYQQVIIEETYDDRSDSYEYDINLLRDDGTTEDPSNASGGERAIVNLALRAGIYKLIAELHGGDRGQLPPFILDEPTTFLDEGHVGQLEQMLDTIKDWDVPQIIVVSHDDSLIHGADHECHVTIDESSNASQITMRTAGAEAD